MIFRGAPIAAVHRLRTLGNEDLRGDGGGHGGGKVARLRRGCGLHQAEQGQQANQQLHTIWVVKSLMVYFNVHPIVYRKLYDNFNGIFFRLIDGNFHSSTFLKFTETQQIRFSAEFSN